MDGADAAAGRTASKQHGVLALAQARAAGLTYRQIRGRVDAGRWVQLRPTVYRVRGAPPSWRAEVLTAVLAGGPGAVASHATAAHLWGLTRVPTAAGLEVLVCEPRRPRLDGVLVHRTRVLPAGDVRVVDAIACTTPERTLVDLAPRLDDPLLLSVADDALFGGVARRKRLKRTRRGARQRPQRRRTAASRRRRGRRRCLPVVVGASGRPDPRRRPAASTSVERSGPRRPGQDRPGRRVVARRAPGPGA